MYTCDCAEWFRSSIGGKGAVLARAHHCFVRSRLCVAARGVTMHRLFFLLIARFFVLVWVVEFGVTVGGVLRLVVSCVLVGGFGLGCVVFVCSVC